LAVQLPRPPPSRSHHGEQASQESANSAIIEIPQGKCRTSNEYDEGASTNRVVFPGPLPPLSASTVYRPLPGSCPGQTSSVRRRSRSRLPRCRLEPTFPRVAHTPGEAGRPPSKDADEKGRRATRDLRTGPATRPLVPTSELRRRPAQPAGKNSGALPP